MQTAETPTKDEDMPKLTEKEVRPEFRINTGKSGQVFKEGTKNGGKPHPYFALAKILKEKSENYRIAFELMKHNAPQNTIYKSKKGAKVRENIFADQRQNNRQVNIDEAKLIANNLGKNIDILPLITLKNYKSPEFKIDGIIGDGVQRAGKITNTVNNAFVNKLGKDGQLSQLDKTFISVNLKKVETLSKNEFKAIVGSIHSKMVNHKTVEFLIIHYNEKSLIIHNKDIPKDFSKGYDYVFNHLQPLKNTKGNE